MTVERPTVAQADTPQGDLLTTEQLEHLAFLARLELKPAEQAEMCREVNELLGYFRDLQAVDTADIKPMQRPLPVSDQLRADTATGPLPQHEVLALAPAHEGGFIRIPRTLDVD